jgi:hypothetical protein
MNPEIENKCISEIFNYYKLLPTMAVLYVLRISGLAVLNSLILHVVYSCLVRQEFMIPAIRFLVFPPFFQHVLKQCFVEGVRPIFQHSKLKLRKQLRKCDTKLSIT